jgi:hypothetical protein
VFVDSLSKGDANNAAPVKDWRGKVVGYRDIEHADPTARRGSRTPVRARRGGAQGAARDAAGRGRRRRARVAARRAVHGRDDAGDAEGRAGRGARQWRYRSEAARVVVVFTDASFKETLQIPEAKGGSLQDVANVVMANRIILSLFAPNFEGYDR